MKEEDRSRSQVLLLIPIPNPQVTGSLMDTMALVTVAGETVGDEWNMEVAKLARVTGVRHVTRICLTKDWNIFQPDPHRRRVESLWVLVRPATAASGRPMRERARARKARRSSARMS